MTFWHTVATPGPELVGRKVRLYRASGFCLIAGTVEVFYGPGGADPRCPGGHEHDHGTGLQLAVDFDDPAMDDRARQWARDALARTTERFGLPPVYGIGNLRVEVESDA
jgi:hypothetical protein